jgi:hypothetical protein
MIVSPRMFFWRGRRAEALSRGESLWATARPGTSSEGLGRIKGGCCCCCCWDNRRDMVPGLGADRETGSPTRGALCGLAGCVSWPSSGRDWLLAGRSASPCDALDRARRRLRVAEYDSRDTRLGDWAGVGCTENTDDERVGRDPDETAVSAGHGWIGRNDERKDGSRGRCGATVSSVAGVDGTTAADEPPSPGGIRQGRCPA